MIFIIFANDFHLLLLEIFPASVTLTASHEERASWIDRQTNRQTDSFFTLDCRSVGWSVGLGGLLGVSDTDGLSRREAFMESQDRVYPGGSRGRKAAERRGND